MPRIGAPGLNPVGFLLIARHEFACTIRIIYRTIFKSHSIASQHSWQRGLFISGYSISYAATNTIIRLSQCEAFRPQRQKKIKKPNEAKLARYLPARSQEEGTLLIE